VRGRWLYKQIPPLLERIGRRYPSAAVAVLGASTVLECSAYGRIGDVVGRRLVALDAVHNLETADVGVLCDALDASGAVRAAWEASPDEALEKAVRAMIAEFFALFCE
jgi:hypothetical protein